MRPSRGTGKAAPRPAQGRASVVLVWRNAMRKHRKTCFPGAAGSFFFGSSSAFVPVYGCVNLQCEKSIRSSCVSWVCIPVGLEGLHRCVPLSEEDAAICARPLHLHTETALLCGEEVKEG